MSRGETRYKNKQRSASVNEKGHSLSSVYKPLMILPVLQQLFTKSAKILCLTNNLQKSKYHVFPQRGSSGLQTP